MKSSTHIFYIKFVNTELANRNKFNIYYTQRQMNEFRPLEEVYAKIEATPDPVTLRNKVLVDEFVVSDIHTDRYCEKETENEDGRTVITVGTRCASTFFGKLYKLNGPSVNSLERYVLFVGLSRQNPMDFKQDEELAIEMAAENAMVDPIMVVKLPNKISESRFARFVDPYLYTLPEKLVMTSKEAKKKKQELLKNKWKELVDKAEHNAMVKYLHDTIAPLVHEEYTEKYGEY